MTDGDLREQAKELRQQAHETRIRLEGMRLKAKNMGELLISTGEILKTHPENLAGMSGQEWRSKAIKVIVGWEPGFYNESIFRDAFDFDSLVAIADEYLTAKTKLDDLTNDMKRRGIEE